jgi:hypothetical protein
VLFFQEKAVRTVQIADGAGRLCENVKCWGRIRRIHTVSMPRTDLSAGVQPSACPNYYFRHSRKCVPLCEPVKQKAVIQIAIQPFKFEVISDPRIIVLLAQLFQIHANHYFVDNTKPCLYH